MDAEDGAPVVDEGVCTFKKENLHFLILCILVGDIDK